MGAFSPSHLIIVLVIVVLLFGAKKIPELARGLGTGMREFRRGASGEVEAGKETGGAGEGYSVGADDDGAAGRHSSKQ